MAGERILVVDDSQTVRTIVERILTSAGYEVVVAVDGIDAINQLSQEPSLVILDVNMPGLDGYGFCEKLNEFGTKYDNLPIVFLTSLESKALELLGREFGDYLTKPVGADELLPVVEKLLTQAGTSKAPSAG